MKQFRQTMTAALAGVGALVLLSNPGLADGGNNTGTEAAQVQLAHMGQGQGGRRGSQPCPTGRMGPGMTGPGMGGQGMMGRGFGMGHGFGMGPRFGKGHGFGTGVVPSKDLSTDDVRHFLEHHLDWHGNKRLKVGEVKEADEATIIAEIVTVDDSLVQRFKVDRHTGRMKQVD